ncbi:MULTISPECIES: hypothetical protein [unclassified Streptomyces]|uniref:hypothetical protein n=1 Tax=unclassified Streptomyces TaxID=2593676 RepID=UPI0035DAFCBE
MAHRPHPVAARAWRHILRRYRYQRPPHSPDLPPSVQEVDGTYRLSTRMEKRHSPG